MIKFTSDLHFYHSNILKFQPHDRPFISMEAMNDYIASYWREEMKPSDELYVIGDISMGHKTKAIELIKTLPGRIHLIRGNHDHFSKTQEAALFASVNDYKVVKYQGHKIVLFHYPIEEWDTCYRGTIHLHGHCHGNLKNIKTNRFDIGWDVRKRFVSIDEVISWQEDNKDYFVSHHGNTNPRQRE